MSRISQGRASTASLIPPIPAGVWYYPGQMSTFGNNAALGNNNVRLYPVLIERATPVDQMACDVQTAGEAGCVVRLGIYADAGTRRPGALIAEALTTAPADVTGAQAVGLPAGTILPAGIVWLAGCVQGAPTTQPALRTINQYAPMDMYPNVLGTGQALTAFAIAPQSGALASQAGAIVGSLGIAPRIALHTAG